MGDPGSISWVGKIPRRKWQLTPVFLSGESHGLSMEFSRPEYWNGWPFPPPDLPTQGLNSGLLHHRQSLYQRSHKGSPLRSYWSFIIFELLLLLSHFSRVRPHRQQPTRLARPWDSPGKNTGVGCHFLLQCVKVKSESEVTQSCLTLSDPMDWSPPGSSIHGIFQARVLE